LILQHGRPTRTARNWIYEEGISNDTGSLALSFYPPGKSYNPDMQYSGDIKLELIKNTKNQELREYYASQDFNPFNESVSETDFTGPGYRAIEFFGINGMIPTNMIAVHDRLNFVELYDIGQQHDKDGILNAMATSTVE
jgi:hypothetical protein